MSIIGRMGFLAIYLMALMAFAPGVRAAENPEDGDIIAEIRAEMQRIRDAYEAEIARLEQRISGLEAKQLEAASEQQTAQPSSQTYAASNAPAPGAGASKSSASAFNPAIGVVFNGRYANFSRSPDMYAIPGFPIGGEAGPGPEGFALDETEFNFAASVNDIFRAEVTFALDASEEGVEVDLEEAFIQTTGLPHGITIKAGRFFAALGYLNENHDHTDNFVNRPLPYQVFLADQYNDDGVQVAIVMPTELYIQLGGGVFRGADFPAGGSPNGGVGSYTGFLRLGGDIGFSHSWRGGVSYLHADAMGRVTGEDLVDIFVPLEFTGDSDLVIIDFKYQWAPNGNTNDKYFIFQGEFFQRWQDGTYNGVLYHGMDSGWYVEGIYKFHRNWRTGYRYAGLNPENTVPAALLGTLIDPMGVNPRSHSFMLDWARNEFSLVRVQFTSDKAQMFTDNRFFIQYIMAIGAHGAHNF